jgi:hypothetical protein
MQIIDLIMEEADLHEGAKISALLIIERFAETDVL